MGRQRIIGPDSNGELLSAIAIEYGPDKLSRSAQRALARNFNPSGEPVVVMYATESCGYCRKAERYFRERGIAYLERDIEKDPSARRDFETLVGTGTPLLFHGYERMVGFDERKVKRKLR
ncbi:MAG: glutaredoxin family protein, partial [Pseudomonadota bacterium]